ncbi:glycogen synthase [Sphingobacterium mizutaii NBRC 14946 = DSM 11724]|uniref:Glycogen synthase n=2 Tax=Sphingobacterium mizutaii TaxID=1010 RepID=A0AAJ4XAJ4_9SPHI|nr:glycogen/starch synthase [Sphingobacterium mizutaii]GEM69060.1 glycogen synthase [Sphingobacterium mizutaii NBRC 14946 = DSM 11724]SDK93489.1 starch synthase [Sphingobacterium mizutaii]SNV48285.1 Glycogen synthase [Sphingobacterium mizutaii]
MKVIHLSVECFPVAKVGGLADVVGALPKYQRELGIDASVIMPYFNRKFVQDHEFDVVAKGEFQQGSSLLAYEILKEKTDELGFPLYLLKIPNLLDREEIYCYQDEADQWIAFQHAVLHYLKYNDIHPDVLHCHDHHVGLVPFLTKWSNEFNVFKNVKTVVTVHNGQYQGWMSWSKGIILPSFDTWKWGLLDWDGLINPLATAIKCCDAYTTVSEGYLKELFVEANGLQHLFSDERSKAVGIVNGIDTSYWDPEIDALIDHQYSMMTVNQGKAENKMAFCKEFGLDPSKPLLSYIGRFATEKGADILPELIQNLLKKNSGKLSIFILGSGDSGIQQSIEAITPNYKSDLAVFFGYNEQLAHRVYAASDLLIMPSRVEPCGLNQLYALKYGTIPVVRKIGGLRDTVKDVEEGGYGFLFNDVEAEEAAETVKRAIKYLSYADNLTKTRDAAMVLDYSWNKSAKKYIELYNQLLK